MASLRRLRNRIRRWVFGSPVPLWYSPAYRLPLPSVEAAGIDVRRADLVVSYLLRTGLASAKALRAPERVDYRDVRLVHSDALLEDIQRPEKLAQVFRVDPSEVIVDELLTNVRLVCGGTLAAARHVVRKRGAALNLLGGFHHAGPGRVGGFCPVNDVAIAIAVLRRDGFAGWIAVLDLDAHPPDGIAECVAGDERVWVGSLSGTDWGPLAGVDETRLPDGCGDDEYLDALGGLLSRMPPSELVFVIAGGDVLRGDLHGGLGLTLTGAQRRDLTVLQHLAGGSSVWLPGGGYGPDAWRVLAGTAAVLVHGELMPVAASPDPLRREFAHIAARLRPEALEGNTLTERDLLADLGHGSPGVPRFLGYYTVEGLEHAFTQYGVLEHLRRLGYGGFRFAVDRDARGDRLRLHARAAGVEHLLLEAVVERRRLGTDEILYIHWLTLRNPRALFSDQRPQLPGQDAPGLGLAREAGELFGRAALRLGLAGIAFRPAWYHMAYQARRMGMTFAAPEREARFAAMLRDLSPVSLRAATLAVAEGRVLMDGKPYAWEPDLMVYRPGAPGVVAPTAPADVRFTLVDAEPTPR